MNKLLIAMAASTALALAGAGAGAIAQEIEPEEQGREEAREDRAERDRISDRFCIQQTGSRIIANRNARSKAERTECVASGGRVYTREDIERTGSTDLMDALRRLDPAIR
ncbi:hypothetical protein [Luteimonas qiangzhengi]|uniref:hypothetical protein n=1 Tax=Luteimonas sp. MJ146 TaxID=3129240 RepID=UPI0031BADAF6